MVIGDVIGIVIKYFEESEIKNWVFILLIDGNDVGSKVLLIDVVKIVVSYGVKIYIIVFGDLVMIGEWKFDSKILKCIVELIGGNFYYVMDIS